MVARSPAEPGPSQHPERPPPARVGPSPAPGWGAGNRAAARRPPQLGAELSRLFAAAGNRAAARAVRSLQRDDYTKPVPNIKGTGITRLEVRGLKFGVDAFEKDYDGLPSDERNKTRESPSHMAVVLVPDKLELDQPVEVILHFHGWGFRKGDPYAGYLVAASGGSVPGGTVRDVAQEHWEQQIASLSGKGAQIVAILAQGRGKSEFGGFPTFEYIRDVLEKSGRPELVKLAESERYSVVLSAHSGGGSTKAVPMLRRGDADTADRSSLKAQVPSAKEHRVVGKLQPVDLVVLFEALNGDSDVLGVIDWVRAQITRLLPQLEQNSAQALAATPVLRGYYGKRSSSAYHDPYRWLACLIAEDIQARVPEAFRQDVSDRFRIIEVTGAKGADVEHEQVISGTGAASSGSLADALQAARNPQSDRARAVSVDAAECAKLKRDAKARADARAAAAKKKRK
jgi:hypothetical protein